MPINGVVGVIVAENAMKKGSESALTSALSNANEEAKKMDLKNGKKRKGVK